MLSRSIKKLIDRCLWRQKMRQKDKIEAFVQQTTGFMPPNLTQAKTDFEANIKQAVQHLINELQLVNRDEFDIQNQILSRTQEKLSALEIRLLSLEKNN